jgi:Ala-tRNA(Pro) deacylase
MWLRPAASKWPEGGCDAWNEGSTAFWLLRHTGRAALSPPADKPSAQVRNDPKGDELEEDPATFHALIERINKRGIPHRRLSHAPTKTSAESAAVRGVPLAAGAKAMLFKFAGSQAGLEHTHVLCVLSAAKEMSIEAIREQFGKKLKMASPPEVKAVTGCIPGAVPPFGSAFRGSVLTVVDRSILEQESINFNCGIRTESVCDLPVKEYLAMEEGHVVADISKD